MSVNLTDGEYVDSQDFVLTVNAVNDAPILTAIEDQVIDEDGVLSLTLSGSDVDGDDLVYSASIDGNGTVDVVGTDLTVTSNTNYNGSIIVSVHLTDGEYVDSQDFVLTVNAVNDAPILTAIEDQVIDEDGVLSLTLSGSDIDGDDLSYSASIDGNGTVDVVGTDLTVTSNTNYNGSIIVSVNLTDGEYVDFQDFVLTVNAVNDAPISQDVSDETNEDTSVDIVLIGSDIDSSDLSYLIDENSLNGDVSITDNIATFTPDLDFNGTTTFTYLVTDGELASSSSTVTIVVNAVNDAPILTAIEDQVIDEDGVLSLTLSGSDIDGDDLSYSASIDGNGTVDVVGTDLTVTSNTNYNGSIIVSVN